MSEDQHLNSTVDRYISKKAKDVAHGAFLAYWIYHMTVAVLLPPYTYLKC
jgi:diacylglycerol kinase